MKTLKNCTSRYINLSSVIFLLISLIACEKDDEVNMNFTDSRDGHQYEVVRIGGQVWMAENLTYDIGTGSYAYDENSQLTQIYGRLYDWETACDICPEGWHLPDDDEWKILEKTIGLSQDEADFSGWRGIGIGGKLKETDTSHWTSPNSGATDTFGFTALPGGYRYHSDIYFGLRSSAYFWTQTEDNDNNAWSRELGSDSTTIRRMSYHKEDAFSVRCIQN